MRAAVRLKAIQLLSDLEEKVSLIERKRQGLGKPNLIAWIYAALIFGFAVLVFLASCLLKYYLSD